MFFVEAGFVVTAFVLGVYFSQKVKDLIAGVPSAARTQISIYEAKVLADIKAKL